MSPGVVYLYGLLVDIANGMVLDRSDDLGSPKSWTGPFKTSGGSPISNGSAANRSRSRDVREGHAAPKHLADAPREDTLVELRHAKTGTHKARGWPWKLLVHAGRNEWTFAFVKLHLWGSPLFLN